MKRSWPRALEEKTISIKRKPDKLRQYLATRTNMLAIAGNFFKDMRLQRTDWLCQCGQQEEQEHLLRQCQVYNDIQAKYDDLNDLSQEVLTKRNRIFQKEKKDNKKEED